MSADFLSYKIQSSFYSLFVMDTISNYKNRALASLKGKWDRGILATIIVYLIWGLLPVPFMFYVTNDNAAYGFSLVNIVYTILLLPLIWGFVVYFLYIVRNEYLGLEHLFDGYKAFKRIAITKFLAYLYTFLWSLLLIIPGIIKAYSYSMTDYILRDEPDLEYDAAITRSMKMMEGHKMELFILHLSFIGWAILSIFTCGLGLLLLIPYMGTAQAHFYEDLKNEINPGDFMP